MSKSTTIPNFRPFAHMKVPGLEAAAGAARLAEDEKTREDEEKVDEEKERDEKDEKSKKSKKAKKTEGDDDDEGKKADKEDESRDENGKLTDDGTKKKDDSEDDDKKDKEARSDERRRIKAILLSDVGVRFPKAAQRLAFEGNLSASDSLAMLEAVAEDKPAQAAGSRLADRMSAAPVPALGAGDVSRGSGPSLAEKIVRAGAKARGEA